MVVRPATIPCNSPGERVRDGYITTNYHRRPSGASQSEAQSKKKVTPKFTDRQLDPTCIYFPWYSGHSVVREAGWKGPLFFLLQPAPSSTHMGGQH